MAKKKIQSVGDLKADPANVNKGTERGRQVIDWSLTELGAGRSILADSDGVVIAGNKTLEVAINHQLPVRVIETDGSELVVVQRTDLRLLGQGAERDKARQLAIADNRASEVGYSPDVEILLEHAQSGIDVSSLYRRDEIDALLASLARVEDIKPGNGGDDFDTTPEETQTRVQYGDLWSLGEHLVLCGDSTKAEDVARVMSGEKADAVLTDPPYGINQEGVTNDEPEKLAGLVKGSIRNLPIERGVVVAFQSTRTFPLWLDEVRAAGLRFERMLWLYKEAQCTFPWRGWILTSESILVATRGEGRWNEVNPYSHDCYKVSEVSGEIAEGLGWHGSVKPLAVIADIAARITQEGDLIYEPFGGSGTTLIACERTKRKARVVEIEPKYVNVIISRWEAETGKTAKLLERLNG